MLYIDGEKLKLVTPALVVKENDAFINDALDRKSYGEALLNLVIRSSDELVVSLDGKWGEGKTTFVKMWQGLLSEANVPNIYIDAFSNDYIDDAFISVASAINSFAETHITKENHDKITELKEKSKKVGIQLLSWSAKVGIKAATLGIIKDCNLEELKDIKDDLAKGTSGIIGDFIDERLSSHSKDVELIKSFRDLLSVIPSKINNNDNKPLVIIIDELDRCKPTYAVEILEKIKHLFSVKNIVFILVMHKEQLEESIKSVYGPNIDAHTYLQKFINLEAKIPKITIVPYSNDLSKYSRKLLKLHELETWRDERNILESIDPLANHFNLSLRQLEKVFTNLAVLYGQSEENHLRIVPIIVFLAVVKVVNPQLFEKLIHQRISYEETIRILGLIELDLKNENYRKLIRIMEWVRYALLSSQEYKELPEEDEIKRFDEALWNYYVNREDLIPMFAKQLSMFVVN